MELGHMGELTNSMLAKVKSAFAARDLSELSQQHDQVVVLREAVLAYLQHVGRAELSDSESDEHARLVAATGEIENMSAAISRELAPLAQALEEAEITPSKETAELLERLFQAIQDVSAFRACGPWWSGTSRRPRPLSPAAMRYWSSLPICTDNRPRASPRTTRIACQASRPARDTRPTAAHLQCG